MAVRFKRGETEIYVETLPRRMFPALIVKDGEDVSVVANFKSNEAANLYVETLLKVMGRKRKNGVS